MTSLLNEWIAHIRRASDTRTPLVLCGSGSKNFYGRSVNGTSLDLTAHRGILNYEPSELVITVRGGTSLAELETVLAEKRQFLPFEPPHFGPQTTIAGCIAAGLSGPRRASAGAVRDFILGVKILDGRGQILTFGGQVMKNVAGYDIARLIAGSMGTLGIILELSLKVLPLPVTEQTLSFELEEQAALKKLQQWRQLPLPISASAWTNNNLMVRLSGAQAAVDTAQKKLGGMIMETGPAHAFWTSIRNHTHPGLGDTHQALWRLSLPATTNPVNLPGHQLIEWGGALRWIRGDGLADDEVATHIRRYTTNLGGHATLFRGGNRQGDIFTPLSAPLLTLHRRLKTAFDPDGIFNPGRLYPGL